MLLINEKNIKYIKFSRKTIEIKDCSEYSYNKLTLLVKKKKELYPNKLYIYAFNLFIPK
jgi:uncharacterized protein YqfB (UPF0267 family)